MSATRLTGYDRALLELRTKNGELSVLVQELLARAAGTLEGHAGLADWRAADNQIDGLRDDIVERSFAIMSLQQLRIQDLRWILGYQRIAQELERIADYACDLAELSLLRREGAWPDEILNMARHLLTMFEFCTSVMKEEKEIDKDLDEQDDILDQAYSLIQRELLADSRQRPGDGGLAFSLILARTLERMGDHVVNVAEMLLYVKTGQRRLKKRGQTPMSG